MWRPNPRDSCKVIIRTVVPDPNGNTDDYGHPVLTSQDITVTAERYPYSDPVQRQAIGITAEEAYTIIFSKPVPAPDAQIIIEGNLYRIVSIAAYEPVQLVVASSGRRVDNG